MKIIYIFRNNDYAAILAAYLHLKMNISPSFHQITLKKMKLYYMGLDQEFNQVYILKYRMKKIILMNMLMGIGDIFNEEVRIIDLGRFDGHLNYIFSKYKLKNDRKELEDYLHENNL